MLEIIINGQGPEPSDVMHASGGTVRLIEIMKRISKQKGVSLRVVSSNGVCQTFINNGINANYKVIPFFLRNSGSYFSLLIDSVFRTIAVSLSDLPANNSVLYAPSDFLWDVFPAFFWKLRNRKAKWVVCLFLVFPHLFRDYTKTYAKNNRFSLPNFKRVLYFFSQQLAISWGKRWADQILVLNNADKEYLVQKKGVLLSKVSIVSGGVEYSNILSLQNYAKRYDGIFLGRFHPQKGIFDLIRIWKLVCEKKPNAKLCIIGSGPLSITEKISEAIAENNLSENVVLVGSKMGDEKFLLLKSSGVFLCPSHYESFAIVIAEAMACGLPVVAYDLPVYKEIYEEKISKVFLGDLNQFAKTVTRFLNDDKYRIAFGLEGQKFVKRYDWDEIAAKELELLKHTGKVK